MQLQCIITPLQAENEVVSIVKGGKMVYDTTDNFADLVTTMLKKAGVNEITLEAVRPIIVGGTHLVITTIPNSKQFFDAINIVGKLIINIFEKAPNLKIEEIDLTPAKSSFLLSLAYDSAKCIYQAISAYIKLQQDISSAQDKKEKKCAEDEFSKAIVACIGTGVGAVAGSTLGAVIGNFIIPGGGAWTGGLVGNYVGRNLGSLAAKAIG